jgi:hypothetical protein
MEHLFLSRIPKYGKSGKLTFITDSLFFAKVKDFVAKFLKTKHLLQKVHIVMAKHFRLILKFQFFQKINLVLIVYVSKSFSSSKIKENLQNCHQY